MSAPPVIDGYTGLVPIGRGGLGDVYRAVQTSTGADVAIKVLRDVSDTSLAWHRTRRELTALLALSGHANVVQIVEVLDLPTGPALVMEHAPGGSLADLLAARGGTLTVGETVFVGRQTAAALVSAHARGIVHRDIKPQNLLIDADGQVQLCDFGIAALTRDEQYRSRTNAVSMRYASPEDLEHEPDDAGDAAVGPTSDVYSLGATLLHLARGAPPTLKERLAPWRPPETGDARLAALDRVLARCLHPVPSMRPTAQGLLDALDGLALGDGIERITALTGAPADVRPPAAPSTPSAHAGSADRRAPVVDPDADTIVPTRAALATHDAVPRPDPPRPVRTGSRWPRALALGVLVLAVGLAVVVVQPDDVVAPSPDTVADPPGLVPRPDDLPPLVDAVWDAGGAGDCLVQREGEVELAVVPCSEPHDLQRFHTGDLDGLGLDAFDADVIGAAVDAGCRTTFTAFVGNEPDASSLQIAQTVPTADTWSAGDRSYACFLGRDGERIVGDAAGRGW